MLSTLRQAWSGFSTNTASIYTNQYLSISHISIFDHGDDDNDDDDDDDDDDHDDGDHDDDDDVDDDDDQFDDNDQDDGNDDDFLKFPPNESLFTM